MHSSVLPIYVWILCNRSCLPLRRSNKRTWPTCEKELHHSARIQNHPPRPLLAHPNLRSPPSVFVLERRSGWKAVSHSATADWNLGTRLCKILFKEFLPHPEICCKKLCESDNASYIIPLESALRKSRKHGSKRKMWTVTRSFVFDDLSRTFVCQYCLSVLSHSRHCEVWFRFSGVFFFFFFFLMCEFSCPHTRRKKGRAQTLQEGLLRVDGSMPLHTWNTQHITPRCLFPPLWLRPEETVLWVRPIYVSLMIYSAAVSHIKHAAGRVNAVGLTVLNSHVDL